MREKKIKEERNEDEEDEEEGTWEGRKVERRER